MRLGLSLHFRRLFKSYFRASRNASVSFFSAIVMLIIDVLAFVISAVVLQSFIGACFA
jgi:hypothetical protein